MRISSKCSKNTGCIRGNSDIKTKRKTGGRADECLIEMPGVDLDSFRAFALFLCPAHGKTIFIAYFCTSFWITKKADL
jgi:hypothetical protein